MLSCCSKASCSIQRHATGPSSLTCTWPEVSATAWPNLPHVMFTWACSMNSLLCCLTNEELLHPLKWTVLSGLFSVPELRFGGASGCCSWLTQQQQQGQIVDGLELDY